MNYELGKAPSHEEVAKLTDEYGGDWGVKHAERLIHLVETLAEGQTYDREVVWLAAYLHDWGGYQPWIMPGIEHYDRSVEVVRGFLTERECPDDVMGRVLECIQFHHGGTEDRSIESRLFTDADALDLLGVAGFARCFSMAHRNLQGGIGLVRKYRDLSVSAISTDKGRELAAARIEETDSLIRGFEEELFAIY